jgi:hypothetical protein
VSAVSATPATASRPVAAELKNERLFMAAISLDWKGRRVIPRRCPLQECATQPNLVEIPLRSLAGREW